ncbi:uncharacterized protein [Rutidosis leptorrhynchoides]|uniref:uncharacterized protein n=1 Tax=Rutidosis leptorrhynchoides TaxID=125765 RepID=UPI003A9934C8
MAGDEAQSSSADTSSPYHLSSSDHPGMNFVGDNLLNDSNYSDWKAKISNALYAKNKIGFVDGTIPIPKEGTQELAVWKRCNAMVRGWLVSSMIKEIKNSVKYAITSRDIWVDLEERFGKENASRAYELRRQITLVKQDSLSVSSYYTILRVVWDEIDVVNPRPVCSCNGCSCEIGKSLVAMRDKERLYDFRMGLNEEYNSIRSQILITKPIPTVSQAFHLVNQDEQQKLIGNDKVPKVENAAAFKISGRNNRIKPSNQNQNWNRRDNRDKSETCTYCQKEGHTEEGCFEVIGYPDWWTKKAKNQSSTKTTNTAEQLQGFTKEDYECLQSLIRASKDKNTKPIANTTGLRFEEPDWDG